MEEKAIEKFQKRYSSELNLIFLMYLSPAVNLLLIIFPSSLFFIIEKIGYIILTLFVFFLAKFKFKTSNIFILMILISMFFLNALVVENPTYVIAIFSNFIVLIFPVLFIINQDLNYNSILKYWDRFSKIFSLLLPIFIWLYMIGRIGYYEIAMITHINVMSVAYQFTQQEKKMQLGALLFFNLLTCLFWGSRSIFLTNVLFILVILLFFKKNNDWKFYSFITLLTALGLYIYNNLIELLLYFQGIMFNFGFSSRNLSLFIQELNNNGDSQIYLSGREDIYPIIIEHFKYVNGFPEGVGVARVLTNGSYYHAHNFILEVLLTFGLIFGVLMLVCFFIVLIISLFKKEKNAHLTFSLLLLIGFTFRSLVGTFFIQDILFLIGFVSLCTLYSKSKINGRGSIN